MFVGGFGSYLLGLNKKTYELTGVGNIGNSVQSYKEPAMGWMVGFLFVVCFVGLFVLIPLRKVRTYEVDEQCNRYRSKTMRNSYLKLTHIYIGGGLGY